MINMQNGFLHGIDMTEQNQVFLQTRIQFKIVGLTLLFNQENKLNIFCHFCAYFVQTLFPYILKPEDVCFILRIKLYFTDFYHS